MATRGALWALVAFLSCPALGSPPSEGVESAILARVTGEGRAPLGEALRGVYAARAHRPLWVGDGPGNAATALTALARLDERGLPSEDYDARALALAWETIGESGEPSPEALSQFDVGLTTELLRAALHLRGGRVDPAELGFRLEANRPALDLTALAADLAAAGDRLPAVLDRVEPALPPYRDTQRALEQLLALARRHPDWPPLPRPDRPVRPGATWPPLALVAERLSVLGDLAAEDLAGARATTYGPELERAVRRFQDRHGLAVDAAIGPATLAALDLSPRQRAELAALSLERWRWLASLDAPRLLVVNVPTFRVQGFEREGGELRERFASRVIVGSDFRSRRTPTFARRMRTVVFSPHWEVPPPLARRELLPRLRREPQLALRLGYVVEAPYGRLRVSPETLDLIQRDQARLRQLAGPLNALGKVKFLFPNEFNVYLHGTSEPELFERANRALSHGCVRVENTEELAVWVLADQPAWSRERICQAMARTEPLSVPVAGELWVVLLHASTSVDADGILHHHRDLYGRDERLRQALERVRAAPP